MQDGTSQPATQQPPNQKGETAGAPGSGGGKTTGGLGGIAAGRAGLRKTGPAKAQPGTTAAEKTCAPSPSKSESTGPKKISEESDLRTETYRDLFERATTLLNSNVPRHKQAAAMLAEELEIDRQNRPELEKIIHNIVTELIRRKAITPRQTNITKTTLRNAYSEKHGD
jgi:hypothetical protein